MKICKINFSLWYFVVLSLKTFWRTYIPLISTLNFKLSTIDKMIFNNDYPFVRHSVIVFSCFFNLNSINSIKPLCLIVPCMVHVGYISVYFIRKQRRKAAFVWLSHHQTYNISLRPLCHCARSRIAEDCAESWQRTTIRRIFQTNHFERNYSGWWAECYFSFKVTFNFCSAQFVRFIGWFSNSFVLTS